MKDALIVSILSITPKRLASSLLGRFAHAFFSRPLMRAYVWFYGVDLNEAERSDLRDYTSLSDLFTRSLKPSCRPIADAPGGLVSPVDGTVAYCGPSTNGLAPFLDGQTMDLSKLLGQSVSTDNDVAVLYLSPKDYHRVHSPTDAHIARLLTFPAFVSPCSPARYGPSKDSLKTMSGWSSTSTRHVDPSHSPWLQPSVLDTCCGPTGTPYGSTPTPRHRNSTRATGWVPLILAQQSS